MRLTASQEHDITSACARITARRHGLSCADEARDLVLTTLPWRNFSVMSDPLAGACARAPHWRMSEEHWELGPCTSCGRHVRCVETACPFCGAALRACLRIPEFQLITKLDRSLLVAIGAALTSAGILVNCVTAEPVYGGPPPPRAYCYSGRAVIVTEASCDRDAGEGGQSSEGEPGGTSQGGSGQGGAP